jgi:hypothetical protein
MSWDARVTNGAGPDDKGVVVRAGWEPPSKQTSVPLALRHKRSGGKSGIPIQNQVSVNGATIRTVSGPRSRRCCDRVVLPSATATIRGSGSSPLALRAAITIRAAACRTWGASRRRGVPPMFDLHSSSLGDGHNARIWNLVVRLVRRDNDPRCGLPHLWREWAPLRRRPRSSVGHHHSPFTATVLVRFGVCRFSSPLSSRMTIQSAPVADNKIQRYQLHM